jgi:hypothetical protein
MRFRRGILAADAGHVPTAAGLREPVFVHAEIIGQRGAEENPEGMSDNSPAFQRRVPGAINCESRRDGRNKRLPVYDAVNPSAVPAGLVHLRPMVPVLKHRASFKGSFGTRLPGLRRHVAAFKARTCPRTPKPTSAFCILHSSFCLFPLCLCG